MPPKKEVKAAAVVTDADKGVGFISSGNLEALEKLLNDTKEKKIINKLDSKNGKNMLFVASEEGRLEMVDLLLEMGARVNYTNREKNTPIIGAAYYGECEVIQLLVDKGGNINAVGENNETAILVACRRGHMKTVEFLFSLGASLDVRNSLDEIPLATAIKYDYFIIADFFLQNGGDINTRGINGNTPLTRAAFCGRIKTVEYILKNGGDSTLKNQNGETALLISLKNAYFNVASVLIEKGGAMIDECDCCGRTALMYGAILNRIDLVTYALERGANVNFPDAFGCTCLMVAAKCPEDGGDRLVDLFLAARADINSLDRAFFSALMHACTKGNIEIVIKLLVDST